ncbi:MAG: GntR family transcriptional regulator [Rhizobiaceae bacterium]|nr:GntR family transcriptional regulator [Rhizobiaceae bacterium]
MAVRNGGTQNVQTPEGGWGPAASMRGERLSERVADAIVNLIAQGHYQPGERITEDDVASRLAVSRVPIREAITTLEAQGILVLSLNRGARVAAFGESERRQVKEARIALESIAARGAASAYRLRPELLERLDEVIFRMELAARRDDWAAMRDCDVQFHRALCEASGNTIILKLWEALSRHIAIIFGREILTERDCGVVVDEHRRLLQVLREGGDVEAAIHAHIMRLG